MGVIFSIMPAWKSMVLTFTLSAKAKTCSMSELGQLCPNQF
jgi:hypothetical protein